MKQLTISILTAATLIFAACNTTENSKPEKSEYVKVLTVDSNQKLANRSFNATIRENKQASVAFRTGGTIESIKVEQGIYVRKGEVMARLDLRDFKTNLMAAEANYLQRKNEFERYKLLYEQGKLPANSFEKFKTAFLTAKSDFEKASNALSDSELKAPFSGFVFQKLANEFETVGPGQPVFKIIDTKTLEVIFGAPETVLGFIQENQKVEVKIKQFANENLILPATIKSINNKAGEDFLFDVRLEMKNPDTNLVKPGMTASVHLLNNTTTPIERTILVPTEAVFYNNKQPHVWVFNDGANNISKRKVSVGSLNGNGSIEIQDGLNSKEKIISAGVHSLREGQKVKPIS